MSVRRLNEQEKQTLAGLKVALDCKKDGAPL